VVLSTLALTGIVFALIEGVDAGWTAPAVLAAAATAIAAGGAFLATELRRSQPLFDVRVLGRRRTAVGAVAILAAYIATLGMLFLVPQHVQYVQGGSASAAGLELAPFGLGLGLSATVSGRLVARYGPRVVLLTGLLTAAAGFVPLLFLSGDSSPALVLLGAGVFGCGLGLMAPPATAVIMNDVGTAKAGDGAAVNQLSRQIGGALGVAIVGSVFAAIYAAEITQDDVPAAAQESIQHATDVAGTLTGTARADLLSDAVASFDVAARWGFAVCLAVVLLSAAWAAVGLSPAKAR
jgi:predicted MFS family arabinose efflux permease